ncbi:Trans-resveratrol di-O-methyltransferase [Morella rubra]|uniref:Trans-resveratrol di-O-methyltransferase n=1 Tax=Morella rubra TaxID=262757 RepID=A0A6A1WE65_9ROSI|nr:Trans-resveratrol di-O-methyltransferase [Morella rubra]
MDPVQSQGASHELLEAQTHLYQHVFNYISSMSIKCVVQLGIPDIIHNHGKPITLPELASALEIHDPTKAGAMHRLMRLLVHNGFFAQTEVHGNQQQKQEEAYDLTPSSRILLKDNVMSLSKSVLASLHPAVMDPWHVLESWVRGDKVTPFENAHGMDFWNYANQNPAFGTLYDEALASDSGMVNLVLRDCKSVFEGLDTLIDVGGGTGTSAKIISEAFPNLKCTVLDLPRVVSDLPDSSNLKFVGGDMFELIPSADAILLKSVLNNWGDEDCLKVLKKCREVISNNGNRGKVIIIDIVLNDKKDKHELTEAKLYFDLLMMIVVSGRQRYEKEWEKLFLEAGFSHYKIIPLFGLRSLVEVYP